MNKKLFLFILLPFLSTCSSNKNISEVDWYAEHYDDPPVEDSVEQESNVQINPIYIREDLSNLQVASLLANYDYLDSSSRYYAQNEGSAEPNSEAQAEQPKADAEASSQEAESAQEAEPKQEAKNDSSQKSEEATQVADADNTQGSVSEAEVAAENSAESSSAEVVQEAVAEAVAPKNEVKEEVSETEKKLEQKLFAEIEKAFRIRDHADFKYRWDLLKSAYPKSSMHSKVEELAKRFFYSEQLNTSKLAGATVEIQNPHARSLEELGKHFSTLYQKGIRSVSVNITQGYGEQRFLFANPIEELGVYFPNYDVPVVDPLLPKLVKLAHDNKLKLIAEIPFRNHTWIRFSHPDLQDEIWDPLKGAFVVSSKLDLFHPKAEKYLKRFIAQVVVNDVDGIVFSSDYSYDKREGFSPAARLKYRYEKGRPLHPSDYFRAHYSKTRGDFTSIYNLSYFDVAEWRRTKIHEFMNKIIAYTHEISSASIGVKLVPEMINEKELALANYSTELESIAFLDADYFMIDWTHENSSYPTDYNSYQEAAIKLNDVIRGTKKSIVLKHPLSKKMMNIVQFNKMSERVSDLGDMVSKNMVVIGPIDRLQNANIP